MKKVLLITLIVFSFSAFAQTQIASDHLRFKADESNSVDANKALLNLRKRATGTYNYYPLNIALQSGNIFGYIENACNGDFKSFVNFLYPDTNAVIVSSTNQKFAIYEHLVGNTIDLKDSNIENQNPQAPRFTKFTKYTVDTIGVRFGYHRHLDSTKVGPNMVEVVDTLVFQFFNNLQLTYTPFTSSGFESFAYPIKTNFNLPGLYSNGAVGTYRLPLTKVDATRDTTTGWVTNFVEIPVGVSINPTGGTEKTNFAYTMVFRPMVKANKGDTVFDQTSDNVNVFKKNNYLSYFFSQNEAPNVKATQTKQYGYYNNSFFTPKNIRYGATVNGWNFYIPGNAYFAHQYVFAYYRVTANNLAVKNTSKDVTVIEAYPNPASENSEVIITLNSNRSTSALVTLTDMTGKVIKTMNAELTNGKNSISLSTDMLSKGMYLINVSGSDFESSSKLVIE